MPVDDEAEFERLMGQIEETNNAAAVVHDDEEEEMLLSQVRSPLPKSQPVSNPNLNEDQRARMLRNRQLAEERRKARLEEKSARQEETERVGHEQVGETESEHRTSPAVVCDRNTGDSSSLPDQGADHQGNVTVRDETEPKSDE